MKKIWMTCVLLLTACSSASKGQEGAAQDFNKKLSIVAQAQKEAQPAITGSINASGGELGKWSITPDSCFNDQNMGFYGVDFYLNQELRMRYVKDEAVGIVLKVIVPDGKKGTEAHQALVFREADCSQLQGTLLKTNVMNWTPQGKLSNLKGTLSFDCTYNKGKEHLQGKLEFSGCG